MKISAIIPTYNRAASMEETVRTLLACDWPRDDLEIVVADDCSPDCTREAVERLSREDPRVKYARTAKNGFTSAARNAGAKIATGDLFLFIDDDNIVDSAMLKELAACVERHPGASFFAPVTLNIDRSGEEILWTIGDMVFNPWTSIPRDPYHDKPFADMPREPVDRPATCSPNALCVPRDVFFAVRGFDEGFGMQFDELDFGMRCTIGLEREGWLCTKAVTRHTGYLDPSEADQLRLAGMGNPRRAYVFGRNRSKFARRHFNFIQALSCCFIFAPLSAGYYGLMALRNWRPSIAWAYLRGTLAGMLGLYSTKLLPRAGGTDER